MLSSANGSKQSLYEALRQSGAANLLENLQSQLKLREGEIVHLQVHRPHKKYLFASELSKTWSYSGTLGLGLTSKFA